LLTDNETIVIEKQPTIDIAPKNRPRKVYGGMWGQTEIATVGVGNAGDFDGYFIVRFSGHSGEKGTRSE
jgi:hypothetical protein